MKYLITGLLLAFSTFLQAQNYELPISGNTNQNVEEGEAHIAIHPLDSLKMVMGFMALDPAGLTFKIFSSNDGGNTWQASGFNPTDEIQNDYPDYTGIGGGDIVFAYDKNGDLYCSWISLLSNQNLASPLDTCIWTAYWAKSVDNGANFSLENGADHFFARGKIGLNGSTTVHDFEDGIADRQWMAIDLSSGPNEGSLYIGYINYPFAIQNTGLKVKKKAANQTAFSSAVTAFAGSGQLTNIGVDANGILHYTFANLGTNQIMHIASSDGGQSFSTPHLIYAGANLFPQGTYKVNGRENAAPSLAIDGDNNLHLVWGDFPFGSLTSKGYYSKSVDGGLTWSTPVDLANWFGGTVFMPVVSAQSNRVSIGANIIDSLGQSAYHILLSHNNGDDFSVPLKISHGITDFNALGTGVFVGDYSSAARTVCSVFSLWTDCRSNGCKQYIAKYDECASLGFVELTPLESNFSIELLYPNPVEDQLSIQMKASVKEDLTITVYNHLGSVLLTEKHTAVIGEQTIQINTSDLKSGHYVVKIANANGTFNTRAFIKA